MYSWTVLVNLKHATTESTDHQIILTSVSSLATLDTNGMLSPDATDHFLHAGVTLMTRTRAVLLLYWEIITKLNNLDMQERRYRNDAAELHWYLKHLCDGVQFGVSFLPGRRENGGSEPGEAWKRQISRCTSQSFYGLCHFSQRPPACKSGRLVLNQSASYSPFRLRFMICFEFRLVCLCGLNDLWQSSKKSVPQLRGIIT